MDSYEKMRKMANISKQLKKHGLADDSTDALKKAEEMIMSEKNDKGFYVSQDQIKSESESKSKSKNERNMDLHIKKMSTEMNSKIDSLSSEISMIRNKMNEMIAKINEIESKIESQPKTEVQAKLAVESESKPVEAKSEEARLKPKVKDEYKPGDVAVDKVFYVGKK